MAQLSLTGKPSFAVQILISAALLVVLYICIYLFFPVVNDYYYYFYPVSQSWLQGSPTLYGNADNILLYPPWTIIFLIIPLGLPPTLTLGSALLTTLNLVLLTASLYLLMRIRPAPRWAVILSALNLFTNELILMGQLDVFTLFGLVLCLWALRQRQPWLMAVGFCLLMLKPYNVLLFGLVCLLEMRRWSLRDVAKAVIPPAAMILISLVATWLFAPQVFQQFFESSDRVINSTAIVLWSGLEQLGLPALPFVVLAVVAVLVALRLAWRVGMSERVLAIILSTTFVFTPYAHADYYVLLIPAFLYVARLNKPVALLAFALSFTPLLRLSAGQSISWISVAFPAVLLLAAWYLPTASRLKMPANSAAAHSSD